MILTSKVQKTVQAIFSYLINLLSINSNAYCIMIRLKAYRDNLKKHLFDILDYTKVKFYHAPMC